MYKKDKIKKLTNKVSYNFPKWIEIPNFEQ